MHFFCFKQLALNIKQKFEFAYHLIDIEILLLVVRVVRFLVGKPLDFHMIQLFQYYLILLKYNKVVEVLSKVVIHH